MAKLKPFGIFKPPSVAAVRASILEFPDGCTTHSYQVINLRYAFCVGYRVAQQAERKRRRSQSDRGAE